MNDAKIVVVGNIDALKEELLREEFGDRIVVMDDISALERELFQGSLDANPILRPPEESLKIALQEIGEIGDVDFKKFVSGPIYLDRPVKDWEQRGRRRMKPRRR